MTSAFGGFGEVGGELEHSLEMVAGGVEFGDALGLLSLRHEGQAEGVVGEEIFGVERKPGRGE